MPTNAMPQPKPEPLPEFRQRGGYTGRRNNPWALTGIVAVHAVVLTALALAKMDLPGPPAFKRFVAENIALETPPPPNVPPPPERRVDERVPETRSEMTVVKRPVELPTQGPVVMLPPVEYVPPTFAGPVGDEVVPPYVPPLPQPKIDVQPAIRLVPVKVKPRGNPASWVTNDDYPASALRAEEQGRTAFRLDVGADGRVTACDVTASSGSSTLDAAACRLVVRRAKFTPGKDADGNAVGGSYANSFTWRIPAD